jgi:hypothetical protein
VEDSGLPQDYAYIIEGGSLTVLDIQDPEAILVAGRSDFFSEIDLSLEVLGNFAYAGGEYGLHIIDISNPTGVFEAGFYNSPVKGLAVQEGYAFLSDWEGLSVVDISDPTNPFKVGSYTSDALIEDLVVLKLRLCEHRPLSGIVDITDPTTLFEVGSVDLERIENISAGRLRLCDNIIRDACYRHHGPGASIRSRLLRPTIGICKWCRGSTRGLCLLSNQ